VIHASDSHQNRSTYTSQRNVWNRDFGSKGGHSIPSEIADF